MTQTGTCLQRDLADAQGALQKQWRELSASFEDQLRHLELECNTKLEQATQQMDLATQRAAERESEACEAHSKERAAADATAVSDSCFKSHLPVLADRLSSVCDPIFKVCLSVSVLCLSTHNCSISSSGHLQLVIKLHFHPYNR